MAGTMTVQPSTFDYFPMSATAPPRQQDVPSLSPVSFHSPLDFSTDSAPSPGSPDSPVFTNAYQLPTTDDWLSWDDDKPIDFTNPSKNEWYGPDLSTAISRTFGASPAVNPMELSNPFMADDVTFCREGLNDTQPLFQSPIATASAAATATSGLEPVQPTYTPLPVIKTSPSASPQLSDIPSPRYSSRKRKSSSSTDASLPSARSSPSPPPAPAPAARKPNGAAPKKTAHNMIEKRYRTNLNDKIAALRDSVPALRVMVHRMEGGANHAGSSEEADGEDATMAMREDEDLCGLAPAHKINKATILSKATEYISHLERKNRNLAKENAALRGKVEGFEMLVMSRGGRQGLWS